MSTLVKFDFPQILMGRGASREIGQRLRDDGFHHAFLVHGPNITRSIVDGVQKSILDADLRCSVFGGMQPQVPDTCVYEGVEAARKAGDIDVLVAVGGGSTMDGTKVINLLLHNDPPLFQYYMRNGGGNPKNPGLPLYMIATTAATGSEVDAAAVVYDTMERNIKNPMGSRLCFMPTLSVIDPELYVTLPAAETAVTGADAFLHSYEAYTGMDALWSPLSDRLALDAMNLILQYLPLAVKDLTNVDYREKLALAAMLSGMATELARNHVGHSFAHAIGSTTHATHGVCAASVVPFVAEFITRIRRKRHMDILKLFGIEVSEDISSEDLGAKLRDTMFAFWKRVGVPTLKDEGISRASVMAAADLAYADRITHRFEKDGCDLTQDDVAAILKQVCDQADLV